MSTSVLLVGALLILVSILFSPLSHRMGMPVLLLFLVVGLLAGSDGVGGIHFNNVHTAFIAGNLALAVILLDGGMRTRTDSFRVGLKPALALATLGVLITAGVTGLAAWAVMGLDPWQALLLGALVSSTDAAAVFALLQGRSLHLNERVSATLEIESGSNDPMAIFLTLALISIIMGKSSSAADALLLFVQQMGLGALCGWLGGQLAAWLVQRLPLEPTLYSLFIAAFGVSVFAATNELGGSGFLAIYLTGVVLSRHKVRMMPAILQVHDGLAWLAQMGLFLILGLLITPHHAWSIGWGALTVGAVLIFLARPLAVMLSLWPFRFNLRERLFIAWVGLRGAVPIVLALYPVMAGVEGAGVLLNAAFFVVILSLLVQGTALAPLARRLKLEVPHVREPVRRYALDLPSLASHEVLLYPLQGERWQQQPLASSLRLPGNSLLAGVFRQGQLLAPDASLRLAEGDVAAVIARPDAIESIGRQFIGRKAPRHLDDRDFFGEFVLNGQATIGDLTQVYGVTFPALDDHATLASCFVALQNKHPVVGDRLVLDKVTLVAREMSGDEVSKVGLNLHDH